LKCKSTAQELIGIIFSREYVTCYSGIEHQTRKCSQSSVRKSKCTKNLPKCTSHYYIVSQEIVGQESGNSRTQLLEQDSIKQPQDFRHASLLLYNESRRWALPMTFSLVDWTRRKCRARLQSLSRNASISKDKAVELPRLISSSSDTNLS